MLINQDQFKEAFNFIDQDKDGIVSKNDIRATFDALARLCKHLEKLVSEAPSAMDFTMFRAVFADHVQNTDDEEVLREALAKFDEGDGFCLLDKLEHVLTTYGEKLSKQEWENILRLVPVYEGRIDMKEFATLLTRGPDERDV